jgi:Flp pilus assembly protein CpaB
VLISGLAAVLAAVLLLVYLRSYRSSVNAGSRPELVLVAKRLIPQGTSGSAIAQKGLYQVTTVQKDQLQPNAISDASALGGRIAATAIYPGQQLTQLDFTTEGAAPIADELSGSQRAIAIQVDQMHGLLGQVSPGNYVDVYVEIAGAAGVDAADLTPKEAASEPTTQVRLLAADVMVLSVPSTASPDTILRVNDANAAAFAYTADYERFWLVLRPQTGASRTPPSVATLGTLLSGGG